MKTILFKYDFFSTDEYDVSEAIIIMVIGESLKFFRPI